MTRNGRRLTYDPGIDTEPSWSSDGSRIAFTSNRGGRPQVYQYDIKTRRIQKLTHIYSSSPHYTHDDNALVIVARTRRGDYNIALHNLRDGAIRSISRGSLDDSPSVSPDGNRVVYATRRGAYYRLAVASVDLGNSIYLSVAGGDIKSPSWSPFIFRQDF